MVSPELISILQGLSWADKLYVMQVLIKLDQSYPVWSPDDAVEAANIMLKVLQAAPTQDHA